MFANVRWNEKNDVITFHEKNDVVIVCLPILDDEMKIVWMTMKRIIFCLPMLDEMKRLTS